MLYCNRNPVLNFIGYQVYTSHPLLNVWLLYWTRWCSFIL